MKESVQIKSETAQTPAMIQFEKLSELSDELQCVMRPDGRFVYINPAFDRLLGYSNTALESLSLFELKHPDDGDDLRIIFKNSSGPVTQQTLKQQCRRQDGSYCKLQWRFSRQDETGYYYGIARDVTPQVTSDDIDSTTLKEVIDNAGDAVYIVDDDARIIYANDFAGKMLGYARTELLDKNIYDLSPDVTPAEFQEIRINTRVGEVRATEASQRRKDGSLIPVEVRSSLKQSNGRTLSCTIVRDITERMKTDRKMAELEFAVEHAADAVYISTLDGNFCYVNHSACRQLGYSYDELTSMNLLDIDPGLTPESMAGFVSRYRGDKTQHKEISVHRRKDGTDLPVEITFTIETFQDVDYAFAFVRDISDRDRAEEALQIYEHIVNASSDAMFFVDRNFEYRAVNSKFLEVISRPREEIIGQTVLDVMGWEHFYKYSKPSLEKALAGETVNYQTRFQNAVLKFDRYIEMTYIPYRRADGTITGVVVTAHDISAIKRAEEELRVYEQIVNASTNSMFFVDTNYVYRAANTTFLKNFDKKRDEVIGLTITEVMGLDHFQNFSRPNINKCLAGETISLQTWYQHPLRGRHFIEVMYIPCRWNDGAIAGVVISTYDITSLKEAQERLLKSEKQLKEAQRLACLGFWEYDVASGESLWSDEMYNIYGVRPDKFSITLANLNARVHPSDRNLVRDNFESFIKTGEPDGYDYRIVVPDGTIKYIHVQGEIRRDENGRTLSVFGTVQDITARKQAEMKTAELHFTVENAVDAIYISAMNGNIRYANDSACRATGYSYEELTSMRVFDLNPGLTPEGRDRFLEQARLGINHTMQGWHRRKDGSLFPIEATVAINELDGINYSYAFVRDVTERFKVMEELRESEARFKSLFERSAIGMAVFNWSTRGLFMVNPAFMRMLGYSREELLGRTSQDITYPADVDLHIDMLQKLVDGEIDHFTLHKRYSRKDSQIVWGRTTISLVRDEEGRILFSVAQIQDVTKAREAIRQSEELHHAIENSMDAVILVNENAEIYYVNNRACEELGYSREELTRLTVYDLDPELTRGEMDGLWQRATDEHIVFERRHRRRDGTFFPVEIITTVHEYEGNQYACNVCRNISERKQSLRQMEELKFAISNAADSIYLLNTDGMIFYANNSAMQNTGYSYEELTGMSVFELSPEFTRDRWQEYLEQSRAGENVTLETVHIRRDSSSYPVEVTGNMKIFADTEIVCAIARDITERKQAARKMEALQFAIENSNDGVMIYTEDAKIHYVNDSLCRSLGYSSEELLTMTLFDTSTELHPDTWPRRWQYSLDYLSSGRQRLVEDLHRHKDGTLHPVELSIYYAVFDGVTYGYGFVRDISERKRAARQMEELQFAIENTTEGLIIYRQDSMIHYVNDSLCRELGYSLQELKSMSLVDFVPELTMDNWSERWQISMGYAERGEPRIVEGIHRRKDGSVYPVEVSVSFAEFDGITYGYGFVRNITERKRAARQMEELEFAIKNATDGVIIYNHDASIHYVNNSMCNTLGYTRDEMLSLHLFDFATELNEDTWQQRWHESREFLSRGIPRMFETSHRRKDGTTFPVEVVSNYVEFDGIAYGYSFVRDISERKQAARQTEELRFAVDNAIDAVFLNDRDGDIYYVNKSACRQLGYSHEELTSMNIADIDPSFSRERLRKRLDDKDSVNLIPPESWHYRKDGSKFPVEISFNSREYEGVEYLCSFVRDVTERNRIERELRNYREHLEDLVETRTAELKAAQEKLVQKERLAVLGQLTGVVSHELRNPLGTIRSSIYLLREKVEDKTGLIERAINRAERNIVRCDQIIEELLDYARAPQTVKQPVRLDEWLASVLDEYVFHPDITVETSLRSGVTVPLETDRFERCIINVLSNACEAMLELPGDGANILQVQTRARDDRIEIMIMDSGPGIAEELQARIFEPLFSTKGFGVGLGLPIVEQIMQQHNGKVSITSSRDTGTMVTLTLPVPGHILDKEAQ